MRDGVETRATERERSRPSPGPGGDVRPSPLAARLLHCLLALLGCILLWASFGRLDIVAVAQGRLVPRLALPTRLGVGDRVTLAGAVDRASAGRAIGSAAVVALPRPKTPWSEAGLSAKLAEYLATGRPVVVICGDWGFRMSGMDLTTCVQERLGVVFVVLNDGVMNMVEAGFRRVYKRPLGAPGPAVDFVRVAESCGAVGLRVRVRR